MPALSQTCLPNLCWAILLTAPACPAAPPAATPPAGLPAPTGGPPWRPGYLRPAVIDVHGHIMPTGLERLATLEKENGLAGMVNLSGGSDADAMAVRVEMSRLSPGLVHFYNPSWDEAQSPGFGTREAARLDTAVKQFGFKGLKIAKVLGLYLRDAGERRVPVDWPELDPLWAKAGELGVPVAVHTADPKAFWLPLTPENERYDELRLHPAWSFAGAEFPPREQLLAELEHVLGKHPETTFLCVHFGNNSEDLEYVDRLLDRYPNALIDTAARLGEIGRHPPDKVRAFFVKHKERILFGTDLGLSGRGIMLGSGGADPPRMEDVKPFYDAHWRFFEGHETKIAHPTPIQGAWTIDAVALPDDVLEHLYHKNAERLLGLAPARR